MDSKILARLDIPALETIKQSICKVQEGNLCAIEIEKKAGTIVFCLDQMTLQEYLDYRNSGGIQSYHTPGYHLAMIDEELLLKEGIEVDNKK